MTIDENDLDLQLRQFTGTIKYYRITHHTVLTDGAKFLADNADAYWLMTTIASYLTDFIDREDFIVAKLTVDKTTDHAVFKLDNGNGLVLAEQIIEYTDFALSAIKLYACWTAKFWVVMLPSEY